MKPATQLDDLQVLESVLRERLCLEFPQIIYFQVQCLLKERKLMVLVQHPVEVMPDRQQVFRVVEEVLRAARSKFPLSVNLYMRVAGNDRPYAFHEFALEPSRGEPGAISLPVDRGDLGANPWDSPSETEDLEAELLSEEAVVPTKSRSLLSSPLFMAGAGVAAVVLGLGVYGMTRPCVIGGCQEIQVAQQLSKDAMAKEKAARSETEITDAKQRLSTAISSLQNIPSWSGSHQQAQELIASYQKQDRSLDTLLQGLEGGKAATSKAQNPPHTVSEWKEIQQLWQEAIAKLQQVPPDSNAYSLASTKLKEYQVNLALANQQAIGEEQAQKYLETAKEEAGVAKALQGIARSAAQWQQVQTGWQSSVSQLQQIEQRTTAYEQAQPLLKSYQAQLAIAQQRYNRERDSASNYNLALSSAQKAQSLSTASKWPDAIAQWRNAVGYLKQVPKDTLYHGKVQGLTVAYTQSIQQSQAKLQLKNDKLKQADKDLQQTCAAKPRICSYTIANNAIKVRLTPDYTKTLKDTALTARAKGDYNAQIAVVDHVLIFGEALEAISYNAGLRLEVYGANGALIQAYNPNPVR
jgi:hypothetical protein